ERGNLDALEQFVRTGRTRWLTAKAEEQFELTTFTPDSLEKLFRRAGFDTVRITGKTIVPVRQNPRLLETERAVARLIKLEETLARDPASAGRAGHLQV